MALYAHRQRYGQAIQTFFGLKKLHQSRIQKQFIANTIGGKMWPGGTGPSPGHSTSPNSVYAGSGL